MQTTTAAGSSNTIAFSPDFTIKPVYVLVAAAYVLGILLFANADTDAAALFALLVPAAGVFVLAAVWNKHLTLTLFALLFFVANGLSPAFFFLQRDIYTYAGWGAVGDFDFTVGQYLPVAGRVFLLMAVITLVCLLTSRAAATPNATLVIQPRTEARLKTVSLRTDTLRPSLLLAGFVVFIGIPLSVFMFRIGIGIVGVENVTRLPFRLSGILYYVRYFLIPVLVFYLYAKSNRSLAMVTAVLLYAAVAGVASVSRSLLILSAVSVPVYAYLDRKFGRLIVSTGIILSLYAIVTAARIFVYSFEDLNLLLLLTDSQLPSLDTIAAITSRLGGAQDNVLAYQYHYPHPFSGIIRFFLGRPILENYALEVYGFDLPAGMAFGVGFTLFPSLVMLARDPTVLVIVGTSIALVLVVFEKLVKKYQSLHVPSFALASYPLAFLLVFTLFGANFKALYFFFIFSTVAFGLYQGLNKARQRVQRAI